MSWADNFNTYTEACIYYGCDTPEQIEAEMRHYDELGMIETQDELEAYGGTVGRGLTKVAEHEAWTAQNGLLPVSDATRVRLALWGSSHEHSTEHLPADLYDDGIPF